MQRAAAAAHPFVVGQWVRGKEFYGRGALIEEILDGPRDGIWLLGTRRIGKTSLLKQVEHLTASGERGFFPLFWDFQGAESADELSADFADALLDVEERLAELGIGLEEVRGRTLFTSLGRLRRRLHAKRLKLLLLCDEVEELIRLRGSDPALLRKLRHAVQSKEGIRSVLASSLKLWALGDRREDTSPFLHGFLPPLYLERLDGREAGSLILQEHLDAAARPAFDPEVVAEVQRRCAGHPYLLQLLAARCRETGDLAAACEDVAADPTVSLLFAADFDTVSADEQRILRCVAERAPAASHAIRHRLQLSSGTLAGELQRLESLGLLDRDEDRRFSVANPFFCRWLLEHAGAPLRGAAAGVGPGASLSQNLVTAALERVVEAGAGGRTPEELLPLVYDELRRMARRFLARERPGHTLQATALVHEAYLKLVDQSRVSWQGRTHFLAVGARAMRRLLIDYARTRGRAKRGGGQQRVTLNEALAPSLGPNLDPEQLLALDAALEKLAAADPRQARIVELRFFAGLTVAEVAQHLGLSKRTVNTEWSRARLWLERELSAGGRTEPTGRTAANLPPANLGE